MRRHAARLRWSHCDALRLLLGEAYRGRAAAQLGALQRDRDKLARVSGPRAVAPGGSAGCACAAEAARCAAEAAHGRPGPPPRLAAVAAEAGGLTPGAPAQALARRREQSRTYPAVVYASKLAFLQQQLAAAHAALQVRPRRLPACLPAPASGGAAPRPGPCAARCWQRPQPRPLPMRPAAICRRPLARR
jgi:hypothetical protein